MILKLKAVQRNSDFSKRIVFCFSLCLGLLIGCDTNSDNVKHRMESDESNEVEQILESLEGVWASCPEDTKFGPMFSELEVSAEGRFEIHLLGRSQLETALWSGETVLSGQVDLEGRQLIPDADYQIPDEKRWEYVLTSDRELFVRAIDGEGVEETRLKKLF